jgi:branched-chain amino acid transport system permease protein
MYALRNLEEITAGTKGLDPVAAPRLPGFLVGLLARVGVGEDWRGNDYRPFYYLTLTYLIGVYFVVRNLERSRLGRAWVALREDELAATCMGLNAARLKLAALALGAGLAGLAGGLFATLSNIAEPTPYDFNKSVTMLCCLILGGLGSRNGVLLGVLLVVGYDIVFAPVFDMYLQRRDFNPDGKVYLSFSGWKLMVFGLVLIGMMLFRPEGMLPSARMKREMHAGDGDAAPAGGRA